MGYICDNEKALKMGVGGMSEKKVRKRALEQCSMLGKSSSAWLSMGHEEGTVRHGAVREAGVHFWKGIYMVQLSSTSTFYLFFVVMFYKYMTGGNFSIIFTHKGCSFLPNDLEKEDINR